MDGFNPQDVLYLIMTDRFAVGDLTNDSLHAQSNANSVEAVAERAKPKAGIAAYTPPAQGVAGSAAG